MLPASDETTLQSVTGAVGETYSRTLLVELPLRGPRIRERTLLGYIVQRSLKQSETTAGVIAELERQPYEAVIIDNAEKLHHEAMLGICSSLQKVSGVFLLIARNQEAFMKEAGKIRAGLEWLLSRAIWNNDLAQSSELEERLEVYPVFMLPDATDSFPPLPDEFSDLEFQLHRLKTAIPSAQGGYGLAMLLPEDTVTVPRIIKRIRQETADRVALAQLPTQGPKVKLRQLVECLVERSLNRGEQTDDVLRAQIWRQYNIIVIDRAERLHHSTLMWICSNLRSVADAFLLVVRDQEMFMRMIDKTNQPAWVLGRSINVNLHEMI